jgi:hypothetical protein
MKTTATNRKVRQLLTAIKSETLLPRPEFQRRLVWTNKHKLAFLDTVLNNYPFPEIYIAVGDVNPDSGEGTELLVDGQQRITTLYQYFMGSPDLRLANEILPYTELTNDQKLAFLQYEVVVRDLGKMEIDQIKEIFKRINSTNYALNAMEISNSRFEGELKFFAEKMSQHPFFDKHSIFSATELRRMQDLRFLLTIIITMMSAYFNRDEALEDYLRNYNDEFEEAEDIQRRLNATLDFIEHCDFPEGSRVWKKSDLFTLLIELDRMLKRRKVRLNLDLVAKNLSGFYDLIDRLEDIDSPDNLWVQYHTASIQATNDRRSRYRRGEVVELVLSRESEIDWAEWSTSAASEMAEELVSWFFEHYKDPADGVPFESREGGYQYVSGGPYDAKEELSDAFPYVPDQVLQAAVETIERDGHEWVKSEEY